MVIRDTNCGNIDGGQLLERNVIAQSINTGHDVANIQFDLQGLQCISDRTLQVHEISVIGTPLVRDSISQYPI